MNQRSDITRKSWETIEGQEVNVDTEFIITDADHSPLYSAIVPAGKKLEGIDQIFAKYLNPSNPFDILDFSESGLLYDYFDFDCRETFYVQDNNEQVEDKYTIYYDWTYEAYPNEALVSPVISNSPVPLLDYRMYFCYTYRPKKGFGGLEWYWDTGELFYTKNFNFTEQTYNANFNLFIDFSRATFSDEPSSFSRDFSSAFDVFRATQGYPNAKHYITNGSERIYIDNTCNTHCLYYRNELGGWNWLLVTGGSTMKEQYSVDSYKKNPHFEYTLAGNFNKQYMNYNKNIKQSWELKTGYLTDVQSNKMVSLFRSNLIYLQDLNTRRVYPVNITDNQYQEKTYKNQGRRFAQYTMNVQLAYDKKIVY